MPKAHFQGNLTSSSRRHPAGADIRGLARREIHGLVCEVTAAQLLSEPLQGSSSGTLLLMLSLENSLSNFLSV